MGDLQKMEYSKEAKASAEQRSPLIRALVEHLKKYNLLRKEKPELIRVK